MALNAISRWFGKDPSETSPLLSKRDHKVAFSVLPGIPEERESSHATDEDTAATEGVVTTPPAKRAKRKVTRESPRRPSLDDLLPQNLAFNQQYLEGAGPSSLEIGAEDFYSNPPAWTTPLPTLPPRSSIAVCCGSLLDCLFNRDPSE
ncbi:hypothetical protein IscW_ISCW003455 [Ixodes scapularis]|uniref:Uncharacterized protein n=1 Tax=Ixodes scapularis TaxID=6945 RepID=B7PHM1_IXOSC|nr:hypothetical protein IscW_ISCW003455 [Ixodes scapularis]|eukprot:XP_002403214.1 hypothetical protein IscW_ISCW003455 [Ixodes scapularis]